MLSFAPGIDQRWKRWLGAAFVTGVALIVWFGLLSAFPAPTVSQPFRFDLVEHVLAFGWLSLIGVLLWTPAWLVVSVLVVTAGALELAQMAFPLHQASAVDWGASAAGVAVGWALSTPMRWLLRLRYDGALRGGGQ